MRAQRFDESFKFANVFRNEPEKSEALRVTEGFPLKTEKTRVGQGGGEGWVDPKVKFGRESLLRAFSFGPIWLFSLTLCQKFQILVFS